MSGATQDRDEGQPAALPQAAPAAGSFGSESAWALLLVLAGALLVALPAAWRATAGGASLLGCWVVLWGGTALLVGPLAAVLRTLGPDSSALASLGLGVWLAAGPLMAFAELLKRTTHHRPLGAATFAVVGAGVLCAAVAVAARLLALWRKPGRSQRWWRAVGMVITAIAALFAAGLTLPALRDATLRSGVFDALLAVALLVGAVRVRHPAGLRRLVWVLAPVGWVVVVGAAAITLRAVPAVYASVQSAGPVLLGVLAWLAG